MRILKRDLLIEHLRRSGPGGQHRNRKATGIRLTHLPTGLVIMATEERSQARNLEVALERLKKRLQLRLLKKKKRKKTKPTRSSVEKRLTDKKRRATHKKRRQAVNSEEDG